MPSLIALAVSRQAALRSGRLWRGCKAGGRCTWLAAAEMLRVPLKSTRHHDLEKPLQNYLKKRDKV